MRLYIRADERRVAGLDGTCVRVRVTRDKVLIEERRDPHASLIAAKWALDRLCHSWRDEGFERAELDSGDAGDTGELSSAMFMAALRDDPEDLATHLVYADWLSDRGDPWGELIALQCAREQLPRVGARARRDELDRREVVHMFEHASALWGRLGETVVDENCQSYAFDLVEATWRRGFVRAARISQTRDPELLEQVLEALASLDILALLERLEFTQPSYSSATLERLAAGPWPQLARLELGRPPRDFNEPPPEPPPFSAAAIAGLFDGRAAPALTFFRLDGCDAAGTAALCERLARSPLAPRLRTLRLTNAVFSPEVIENLAGAAFDSLHELRLMGTDLPEDAESRLLEVAPSVHIERIQTDEYTDW